MFYHSKKTFLGHVLPARELLPVVSWPSSLAWLWAGGWTLHKHKTNQKSLFWTIFEPFQLSHMRQTEGRRRDTTGRCVFLSLGVRWFISWLFFFHHLKVWNCILQSRAVSQWGLPVFTPHTRARRDWQPGSSLAPWGRYSSTCIYLPAELHFCPSWASFWPSQAVKWDTSPCWSSSNDPTVPLQHLPLILLLFSLFSVLSTASHLQLSLPTPSSSLSDRFYLHLDESSLVRI